MSDTASSPATMHGWAIKAYGEEMVLMVDLPGAESVRRPGVEIISDYVVRGNGARLADVTQLFDIGTLRLVIHEIVLLDEAQRALDLVLARHVRGKVVLRTT